MEPKLHTSGVCSALLPRPPCHRRRHCEALGACPALHMLTDCDPKHTYSFLPDPGFRLRTAEMEATCHEVSDQRCFGSRFCLRWGLARLEMVPSEPHMFFFPKSNCGLLRSPGSGGGGVASFLPGLSPRLLIFPCVCHTSSSSPSPTLLLPVAEPPMGRARLSPLAAPPAVTYPQCQQRGRGSAVFTLLQPLLPPRSFLPSFSSSYSIFPFSSTCPFCPSSFSSSPNPVPSPPPALDTQLALGPLLCFCPTSPTE